jgi:hypothetical protein
MRAVVHDLAEPLERERRPAFLVAVAAELEAASAIGPGAVYRAAAKVQREHFDPSARSARRARRKPTARLRATAEAASAWGTQPPSAGAQ